ncbi:MAG: flagellar hook-basal body complex protein FliE [Caulobacterales bacterium]
MAIDALSASKAYLQAAGAAQKALAGAEAGAGADGVQGGMAFGDILKQSLNGVMDTGRKADSAMAAAAVGKGDLVDVVTAISAAEMSLQTVVAVRDQAISAYQEIMRMPI